jgi:hypothetical protein
MVRSFSKLALAHSRRLLSLVLLPALVLGTLPQTACLCADGHVEMACRALAARSAAKHCNGCSHCQPAGQQVRSCCQGHATQPGLAACGTNCCHPLTVAPAPATMAGKVKVEAQQLVAVVVDEAPPALFAGKLQPAICTLDSRPPPFDAVIVFQRLTI